MWYDALEHNFRVDMGARMELTLLAQLSEPGYWEANSIISKLTKKVSDGQTFGNPSAFVHKSCKNARESLTLDYRSNSKGK